MWLVIWVGILIVLLYIFTVALYWLVLSPLFGIISGKVRDGWLQRRIIFIRLIFSLGILLVRGQIFSRSLNFILKFISFFLNILFSLIKFLFYIKIFQLRTKIVRRRLQILNFLLPLGNCIIKYLFSLLNTFIKLVLS